MAKAKKFAVKTVGKLSLPTLTTLEEVAALMAKGEQCAFLAPREIYDEIGAHRQSDFKRWLDAPMYFPYSKKYPEKRSQALINGSLFDSMLFDTPEEHAAKYVFGPDLDKRTTAWKDFLKTVPPGAEVFSEKERDSFQAWRESFEAHPWWKKVLSVDHAFQVVCLATMEIDGGKLWMKAALDCLTPDFIVDAKLLEDASAETFPKKYLRGFGYDIQAAWYRYCCPVQGIPLYFACQEKHRFPEAVEGSCQWFKPADEDVFQAMQLILRELPKFHRAVESGKFETYPQGLTQVKIPVFMERVAT